MSDHWDFYLCRVNDALSSIFVDLGAKREAPDAQKPHLLWVWVPMRTPRSDGLSSGEESPALGAIEDALAPSLATAMNARFVGRITGAGRREFYFYAPTGDRLGEHVERALAAFPMYSPEWGEREDPGWSQYLELLYPSSRELERLRNRQVIAAFTKEGDVLTKPRPVTHWAYFAKPGDRALASRRLSLEGFAVEPHALETADNAHPLGLRIERQDSIDQASIDAVVFTILDALDGCDAEYDGWEAPVETE